MDILYIKQIYFSYITRINIYLNVYDIDKKVIYTMHKKVIL